MFSFLKQKKNFLPNYYGLSYAISILFSIKYIEWNKNNIIFLNIYSHIEPITNFILLFGLIFARIGWVLTSTHGSWKNWYKIWNGGQAFFGSVIGIILAAMICSKTYNVPILELTDGIALIAPIIMGGVRMGNYLVGDFEGRFNIPVSLVEAFCHGPLIYLLIKFKCKKYKLGQITKSFFKFYGFSRFFTEFLRTQHRQYFINGLSLEQYLSLIFIYPQLILLFIDQVLKHKFHKTKNYGFNLGILSNLPPWSKITIQMGAAIGMTWLLRKQMNVFFLSGCLSNLYDRIKYGYVVDYIVTPFGICNLADIYLWIGIVLVLIPEYMLKKFDSTISPFLLFKLK